MKSELFRETRPVVLSTNPENPTEGKTLVWAWTQWFERIEGEYGNVAYSPVASSKGELNQWLYNRGLPEPLEVSNDHFTSMVKREFLDQAPLYPETPELSDEEPFGEQKPEDDIEHG